MLVLMPANNAVNALGPVALLPGPFTRPMAKAHLKAADMLFYPTAIFTAIANIFALGQALSPALVQWIEARIPAEKQVVITRRMRRCRRQCKRNKLLSPGLITQQVDLDFQDLAPNLRKEVSGILIFELQPHNLQNYS